MPAAERCAASGTPAAAARHRRRPLREVLHTPRHSGAPDVVFAYDRVSRIGSGDEAFRFELSYGRGLDLSADGTLVFRAFVLVGHEAIGGSAYSWESEPLEAAVGSVESERMLEEGVAALAERLQEGLRVFVAKLPERER